MWLCNSAYVTSVSEVQHPSSPWRQEQGGIHPAESKPGGWGSDGTDSSVVGLSPAEARNPEAMGTGR